MLPRLILALAALPSIAFAETTPWREWDTATGDLSAIYQGDVFPQDVNRHSFRWRLNERIGYLWMNEARFRWNHRHDPAGLPGQFKSGACFHTARFANPDNADLSYAWNCGFYFTAPPSHSEALELGPRTFGLRPTIASFIPRLFGL
jgi:hypothetical protein